MSSQEPCSGGMMKFKFLPDTTGFSRLKHLVQGGDVVRIQVVTDKNDLIRAGLPRGSAENDRPLGLIDFLLGVFHDRDSDYNEKNGEDTGYRSHADELPADSDEINNPVDYGFNVHHLLKHFRR